MIVYVTKYALTRGIFESEVSRAHCPTMVITRQEIYWHKPDWHFTLGEAIDQAELMKQRKIASIRRQLAKVKALQFDD